MESNIAEVEIPPVLLSETIKQEHEENEHAKTEKLNLFLQKQLYHMDNILVKKHAKIVDLKVKLELESKQRQVAEQKVKTLRELVGFYIAEISEMIKNLNANTFPEDNHTDHNASSLQILNLLTSEVSQWFVKCSKHHCKVRQEVSEMQENLVRLEQTLTVRPTTNSYPVEVITIDCSSPGNSEQIQDVHNPISTLETGLGSRNVSKRTRATCRKCGKTFTTRKILYAHHKTVHGCRMGKATKRLIVPTTSTIITGVHRPGTDGRYHGKDASKSHLGIYCVCGMKYRYKSSLNEHIGVLTTEWRFTCNICNKKFYRGAHLRHHMKKAHNARATTFVRCHHCAKQFNDLAQLLRHRRISHSTISKRAAFSKPRQRNNSPDYSNPPPLSPHFSNEMMHQQLENNSAVIHHDFAEPSTNSGSNNNPSRFYCTCSIGFSTRKLLAHHIKAKITGKVFKCSLCPSAFDTHNNLKLHVRNSHKVPYTNGKYGCRDCGSTFHSYQELMSHRLSNHYTFRKH